MIPTGADANSQRFRMVFLQPQATFTTLALAQAEDTRALFYGELSLYEFVQYTRITYNTNVSNTNYGKCTIAGISYLTGSKFTLTSTSVGAASNHAQLSNLSWDVSGHIGTASKIAGFDATGLAVYYDQVAGSSGSSGTSGINGTSGSSGINGTSGSSGINGTSGSSGTNGTSGSSGLSVLTQQVTGVTLASTSWSLSAGLYEQSYANANISATTIVDYIPDNSSYTAVVLAQVLPRTESSAGSAKFFAINNPPLNITGTINIIKT